MKRADREQRSLRVKVRYQADADLARRIVSAVRRYESDIDFRSASEARSGRGLKGLLDDAVLAIAAEEGRILVTHDRRTMPRYFAELARRGGDFPDKVLVLSLCYLPGSEGARQAAEVNILTSLLFAPSFCYKFLLFFRVLRERRHMYVPDSPFLKACPSLVLIALSSHG